MVPKEPDPAVEVAAEAQLAESLWISLLIESLFVSAKALLGTCFVLIFPSQFMNLSLIHI